VIPAALLAEARGAGLTVWLAGEEIRLRAPEAPPVELLARLCAAKAELLALLRGDTCRYCGRPILWPHPGAVAFGDGTGAHLLCYEREHP
jgi:hypothetical protein